MHPKADDEAIDSSSGNMEEKGVPVAEHHEDGVPYNEKETKKLLRKLDLAILPLVSVMYLLSFLDRSNIGNARLAGLEADLGMTGWDYAVRCPPQYALCFGTNIFVLMHIMSLRLQCRSSFLSTLSPKYRPTWLSKGFAPPSGSPQSWLHGA